VEEELIKFFIGSRPIDEYDSFLAKLNEMGIEEMTTLKKQSYERYKAIAE
jgi:putative aldouronate transport system substrate-binding protein